MTILTKVEGVSFVTNKNWNWSIFYAPLLNSNTYLAFESCHRHYTFLAISHLGYEGQHGVQGGYML
jgi:hypothetical protein